MALATATNAGDREEYARSVQALFKACETDWDLEAKLALLHACLVPVSEGCPLQPNTTLADVLLAARLPEREVAQLSLVQTFWDDIRETTIALRQPGAYGGFTDKYQAELTALREMLLPDL